MRLDKVATIMKLLLTQVNNVDQVHIALEDPLEFKIVLMMALHYFCETPLEYKEIKLAYMHDEKMLIELLNNKGCSCKHCEVRRKVVKDLKIIDKSANLLQKAIALEEKQ